MTDETEKKEYSSKLANAYDMLYRSEEGRFFLQHVVGMCDLFDAGGEKDAEMRSAGKRSIAVQIFAELDGLRNGQLIKKRILSDLIDERGKDGDVEELYDPFSSLGR